jgi:tRNA threonylcarbamoyladenosine biosynthesis protein TsaE
MSGPALRCSTRSVEETRALGTALAAVLRPGDVVALSGDLGAGKTAFVQGVARGLGSTDHVGSPTFTLVREYTGRCRILHMDVYRLDRVQDVFDLGFDELFDPEAVLLIEWGEAIEAALPVDHLVVRIEMPDEDDLDRRTFEIRGHGAAWPPRASALAEASAPWLVGDETA